MEKDYQIMLIFESCHRLLVSVGKVAKHSYGAIGIADIDEVLTGD